MLQENNIESELIYRIEADKKAFNGNMPERYVIAWAGYLAGLLEWSIITITVYERLCSLLPPISAPGIEAHEVWVRLIKPALDAERERMAGHLPSLIPLGSVIGRQR